MRSSSLITHFAANVSFAVATPISRDAYYAVFIKGRHISRFRSEQGLRASTSSGRQFCLFFISRKTAVPLWLSVLFFRQEMLLIKKSATQHAHSVRQRENLQCSWARDRSRCSLQRWYQTVECRPYKNAAGTICYRKELGSYEGRVGLVLMEDISTQLTKRLVVVKL
jgi:hypothetical protein